MKLSLSRILVRMWCGSWTHDYDTRAPWNSSEVFVERWRKSKVQLLVDTRFAFRIRRGKGGWGLVDSSCPSYGCWNNDND
jgi:hypothetical protein